MLFYARRIQELTLDFYVIDDYPDLDLDIVFSIFNRINKAAAFSSLRRLIISDSGKKYKNQLALFFISTPNLEVLEVRGPFPGIPTAAFLYAISTISHNLKSVTTTFITSAKAVLDVLPCSHKLQILDLGNLDCHIPRSFLKDCASSMTSLQSLTIRSRYRDPHLTEDIDMPMTGVPSMALSPITFNMLSKLDLTGPHRDVENMLNILHVPQLATLRLDLRSRQGEILTDIRPISQSFLTLNEPYLQDGLRSLYLESDNFTHWDMQHHLGRFQIFTKLDTLQVHIGNRFFSTSSLTNFLHENKLWSNLKVLDLVHFNQADPADVLSIAALPLLADSFPNLLQLSITIENPDQDAMKAIAVENFRKAHSLVTLDFDRLPRDWIYSISTAVTFASFLHRLFPKLKLVKCFREEKWMMNVWEMLKKEQVAHLSHGSPVTSTVTHV